MSHVTGHVTKRDAGRDMSRVTVHVSHATTTTPHYTCSLVTSAVGGCGHPSHPSLQSVRATSQTMDVRSAGYSAVVS